MLSFAPIPIDDEWIYSVMARWHRLSGFTQSQFRRHFNIGENDANYIYGKKPFCIKSTCGVVANEEYVAENYTLKPFFRPFTSHGSIEAKTANSWMRWKKAELRCCPVCARIQWKEHGFAVWLRAHNLPGVTACWQHGVGLHGFKPHQEYTSRNSLMLMTVPSAVADKTEHPANDDEIWFARTARWILNSRLPTIWPVAINRELQAWNFEVYGLVAGWGFNSSLTCRIRSAFTCDFLDGLNFERCPKLPLSQIQPTELILLSRVTHGSFEDFFRCVMVRQINAIGTIESDSMVPGCN